MEDKSRAVFNMFNLLRKLDYLNNERLKANGLNNLETLVLLNLYCKEDVTQKDLVAKFKAPKQTINSIVNKLLEKDLVETKPDPIDKRSKILFLTTEGKNKVDTIKKPLAESNREIYDELGKERIDQITYAISDLIDCLEKNK